MEKCECIFRIDSVKQVLYVLFGILVMVQECGKMLEIVFNNFFQVYGVFIYKVFYLVGDVGEGIVEQIDGVIEFGGMLYFVEMKWYCNLVGKLEILEYFVCFMLCVEV